MPKLPTLPEPGQEVRFTPIGSLIDSRERTGVFKAWPGIDNGNPVFRAYITPHGSEKKTLSASYFRTTQVAKWEPIGPAPETLKERAQKEATAQAPKDLFSEQLAFERGFLACFEWLHNNKHI